MKILAGFCLLFAIVQAKEGCDEEIRYKVKISGDNEVGFFKEILQREAELGVIIERPAKRMNITHIFRVSRCKEQVIGHLLESHNVRDYDVEPVALIERRFINDDSESKSSIGLFDFDAPTKRYLSSKEIDIYLDKIAELIVTKNSKVTATVQIEGNSFENRPIKSITVQYRDKVNPIVLIDAGIHAREWHSKSLALNIMRQLATEAELDVKGLIFNTTFIIVPGVNPDGYEFSRKKDKMWRKTRRPVGNNCVGVDGNRNYDAHFYMGDREKRPCQEVYRGTKPFSEPETSVIRDLMMRVKGKCFLYISIHTYGNSIIYPYGYTTENHPRKNLLHQIAMAGVNAVKSQTGAKFTAGQSGSALYVAAGGSDDYAIDVIGIPFAYTFELGAEKFGFQVPERHLKKAVEEGWIAIKAMIIQAHLLK